MDPRKVLTEEVPESAEDFRDRRLTEVDGKTTVAAPTRVLTEVPFDEDEEEDTPSNSNLLLG